MKRKTGARALRSIIEHILKQPKFEVPGSDIEAGEQIKQKDCHHFERMNYNNLVHISREYVSAVFSTPDDAKYEFKRRLRESIRI